MNSLDEINQIVKNQIVSLDIFNLPLNQAIVYLLRVFEDSSRLPILAGIKSGNNTFDSVQQGHFNVRKAMDGLSVLMPLIYKNNSSSKKVNLKRYKEKNYLKAGRAIEVAEINSVISDFLSLTSQGFYQIKKKNNSYFFLPNRKVTKDAASQVISLRRSHSRIPDSTTEYEKNEFDRLINSYNCSDIKKMIIVEQDGSMVHNIPRDFFELLQKKFGGLINKIWTLDDQISFGAYSIKEAQKVWIALVSLCAFQSFFTSNSGLPGIGMEYLPIVVKKKYLTEYLS